MWKTRVVATCLVGATVSAQVPVSTPPRFAGGGLPELPVLAVGGGQAFVEVSISPAGEVTSVATLRTTPLHTEAVGAAVRRWRFKPAMRREDGLPAPKPVASKALVAAHFTPPTLIAPTVGEVPKDVGTPSADVPLPVATVEPPYHPQALSAGVVLIEALVNEKGQVTAAAVLRSAPPFDEAALTAARQWRFRPSSVAGRAVATYAYLIFGFQQPNRGLRLCC